MRRQNRWKQISAWILASAMALTSSPSSVLAESLDAVAVADAAEFADDAQQLETEAVPAQDAGVTLAEDTEIQEASDAEESETVIVEEDAAAADQVFSDGAEDALSDGIVGDEDTESYFELDFGTLPLSSSETNQMLPNGSLYLSFMYAFTKADFSEWTQVPFTNVEVVAEYKYTEDSTEECSGEVVRDIIGNSEDGWTILAGDSCGYAQLQLTYVNTSTGNTEYYTEEDYCVYVNSDVYSLDCEYADDTEKMYKGASRDITVSLYRAYYDEGGEYQNNIADVEYTIAAESQLDSTTITVDQGNKTLTVNSFADSELRYLQDLYRGKQRPLEGCHGYREITCS